MLAYFYGPCQPRCQLSNGFMTFTVMKLGKNMYGNNNENNDLGQHQHRLFYYSLCWSDFSHSH